MQNTMKKEREQIEATPHNAAAHYAQARAMLEEAIKGGASVWLAVGVPAKEAGEIEVSAIGVNVNDKFIQTNFLQLAEEPSVDRIVNKWLDQRQAMREAGKALAELLVRAFAPKKKRGFFARLFGR